jgi:DNA (cytosine-5)-methyltransferase 1
MVQPFIMPLNHGGKDFRSHDPASPMPTITGLDAWGKVSPLLVEYYGNGEARPVHQPCPTVVTRDRFGLVEFGYDILFRMLQPHELVAAMGFPPGYNFAGTRDQKVKQIGNAVEVNQAQALISAAIAEQQRMVA